MEALKEVLHQEKVGAVAFPKRTPPRERKRANNTLGKRRPTGVHGKNCGDRRKGKSRGKVCGPNGQKSNGGV